MVSIDVRDDLAAFNTLYGHRDLGIASRGISEAASYSVSFATSASDIGEELWATGFPAPLEGRWWYETLEASGLHDQFTFYYAVVSRLGRVAGIAPIFMMDVPIERVAPEKFLKPLRMIARVIPSIMYQRTLFVGSPCSDEGAMAFTPWADRRAVVTALQDAIEKKSRTLRAELIVWKEFPAGVQPELDWLAQRKRLFRTPSLPGTIVQLPSASKADYLKTIKSSRRYALKKKLKSSADNADLVCEILHQPAAEVVDEIFALFWQTYSKSETKFEELNKAWFQNVAALDNAYFVTLKEKSSPSIVAFMLVFRSGSRLINKYVGLDYAKPRNWFLYFRLWDVMVDWALSQGFTAIQSGQTAYPAKLEMGHQLYPLFNYVHHRNFLMHAIYRLIGGRVDWKDLDDELALVLKANPTMLPPASGVALPAAPGEVRAGNKNSGPLPAMRAGRA